MAMLELLSENACFDWAQRLYLHQSTKIGLPMKFSVFVPPVKGTAPLPTLFYLAGLAYRGNLPDQGGRAALRRRARTDADCTRYEPPWRGIDGEIQDWTYGTGAGFYVDATQEQWQRHYQMESYVAEELHDIAVAQLNAKIGHIGVSGHPMGGHGPLCPGFRHAHASNRSRHL